MSDIKDSIEDIGDKMKAASKAAASKVKDPEIDINAEYQKEKMKEEALESSSPAGSIKVSKLIPSSIPQYKRILVPDDRSESSDKALSHAVYLSNSTGSEIVILNVIENIDKIEPTTIEATTTTTAANDERREEAQKMVEGIADEKNKEDIQITLKGQAEQMVEERIGQCKQAGARNQVSYKMQTGKRLVDEILELSEDMDIDLIVMTSSKVTSPIMGLTSATRKVIDSANRPVLVIHEE
jgi:nucleotide-binding universal stress UspA family protein